VWVGTVKDAEIAACGVGVSNFQSLAREGGTNNPSVAIFLMISSVLVTSIFVQSCYHDKQNSELGMKFVV
jgi:hypothetical protein